MGVVRDFSQQTKDDLLKDIENAQAVHEEWGNLSNMECLSIDMIATAVYDNTYDIDAYQKTIIEKKRLSMEEIERIWTAVYEADSSEATKFGTLRDDAATLIAKFNALSYLLDPNVKGGAMITKMSFSKVQTHLNEKLGAINYEKEYDLWLQKEIFELRDERYSQEAWDAIPEEEYPYPLHQEFLTRYHVDVQRILGVEPGHIVFNKNKFTGNVATAIGFQNGGVVYINPEKMVKDDAYDYNTMMGAVMHENRHVYQHEVAIDFEIHRQQTLKKGARFSTGLIVGSRQEWPTRHLIVSDATAEAWANNLFGNEFVYQPNPYTDVGYAAYVSQPVEWDAWNFSNQTGPEAGLITDAARDLLHPSYAGSWGGPVRDSLNTVIDASSRLNEEDGGL